MKFLTRFHHTALLVFCSLLPAISASQHRIDEINEPLERYINYYIMLPAKKIPIFLMDPSIASGRDGILGFFIPNVFPPAAPFILFRLKRTGFSGCRVIVKDGGFLVTASR